MPLPTLLSCIEPFLRTCLLGLRLRLWALLPGEWRDCGNASLFSRASIGGPTSASRACLVVLSGLPEMSFPFGPLLVQAVGFLTPVLRLAGTGTACSQCKGSSCIDGIQNTAGKRRSSCRDLRLRPKCWRIAAEAWESACVLSEGRVACSMIKAVLAASEAVQSEWRSENSCFTFCFTRKTWRSSCRSTPSPLLLGRSAPVQDVRTSRKPSSCSAGH